MRWRGSAAIVNDKAKIVISVTEFRTKLTLWMSYIKSKILLHIPHFKKIVDKADSEENAEPRPFLVILKNYRNSEGVLGI
jgi:hypothetical protein